MKLVTEPPPPLPDRSVAGDVIPPALKLLVSRTLAKKPADRPQTMAELKAELAPFEAEPASGEVAQLFPEHGVQLERELLSPTRFDRPRPEPLVVKKRPTWPYLLAGAILAWGLAAGAWWLSRPDPVPRSAGSTCGSGPRGEGGSARIAGADRIAPGGEEGAEAPVTAFTTSLHGVLGTGRLLARAQGAPHGTSTRSSAGTHGESRSSTRHAACSGTPA